MYERVRWIARGMTVAAMASGIAAGSAQAQWSATAVGVAEYDTNETLLLLAGVSVSPFGGPGISPVFGIQVYRLSYETVSGTTEVWSVRPSAGIRNNFTGGSAQFRVGYAFTSRDAPVPIAGGVGDRRQGVVISSQVDWWGTGGPFGAQAIASYNFGSDALWARGRVTTRVARTQRGQVRVGGEVAFLNDAEFTMVQPGAVVEWHAGPGGPILAFGVGRKLNDPGEDATYFKVEVVLPLLRP
ncbi:MAG TPA: hypothetical protein VMM17_12800 [Gemmatimonadaceae bacterium]|nr:hypothetical protein [Gemmatimonadaceae bacterium]